MCGAVIDAPPLGRVEVTEWDGNEANVYNTYARYGFWGSRVHTDKDFVIKPKPGVKHWQTLMTDFLCRRDIDHQVKIAMAAHHLVGMVDFVKWPAGTFTSLDAYEKDRERQRQEGLERLRQQAEQAKIDAAIRQEKIASGEIVPGSFSEPFEVWQRIEDKWTFVRRTKTWQGAAKAICALVNNHKAYAEDLSLRVCREDDERKRGRTDESIYVLFDNSNKRWVLGNGWTTDKKKASRHQLTWAADRRRQYADLDLLIGVVEQL